jgi:hypothetical protein
MGLDRQEGPLQYDQTSAVPSASYWLPNPVLAVLYSFQRANFVEQATLVVVVVPVAMGSRVAVPAQAVSKEENTAGIPVVVAGVFDSRVKDSLIERLHYFQRAFGH